MIFEAAWTALGPYLKFLSLIVLLVMIYFTYSSIIEAYQRSKKAYRLAGAIGLIAIGCAFVAGFLVFDGERAVVLLIVAVILWLIAQIK